MGFGHGLGITFTEIRGVKRSFWTSGTAINSDYILATMEKWESYGLRGEEERGRGLSGVERVE